MTDLRLYAEKNGDVPQTWPELPDAAAPLPDFPVDALPDQAAEYVVKLSASLQVDPAMAACFMLGTASAAIVGTITAKPKRAEDYVESVQLFLLCQGEPGERKSAVLSAVSKPLYAWLDKQRKDIQTRNEDAERALKVCQRGIQRAQGDKLEGLYFCSYRKTYGPTGMKPTPEGYLLTRDEQRAFVDPRQKPVKIQMEHGFPVEDYDNLFTYVHGNNNTLINPINTATDGPNFKQPTFIAGIDGYMQNADWLLARMNLTTDQGWGHLKQTVTRGVGYFLTRYTGKTHYETFELALDAANIAVGEDTCTAWSVLPVRGLPIATFDDVQDPPGAIYNWYSKRYGAYMSDINDPLPIKDQYYMAYSRTTSDEEVSGNMDRISKHPKTGETDVYIDVGIYEYQYVQLDIKGQEIDTMWVATKVKDPIRHDGLK